MAKKKEKVFGHFGGKTPKMNTLKKVKPMKAKFKPLA